MPDVGSENERSKEKETGSRLGEVTPIAGGCTRARWGPRDAGARRGRRRWSSAS